MSLLLDRLNFLAPRGETFSGGHGATTTESRAWEGAYRARW